MKSDSAVKKHHFWILLGVVPLFTLIGAMTVSSSVGGEIEKKQKEIKDAEQKIGTKMNPKPNALIEQATELVKTVSNKQGNLWQANWDRQKDLYTWPSGSNLLKPFETMDLKFGDPLPTAEGQFDEFRKDEVYINEFSSLRGKDAYGRGTGMADRVAPTQFHGGWRRVLRHVSNFGESQLTKDQVWLIMEDIWVQRSLLSAISSVNDEMASFRRAKLDKDGNVVVDPSFNGQGDKLGKDRSGTVATVPTPEDEKKKAMFRSRTWGLELELVKEGNTQRLAGKLINLSERLQLLGVGNMMTLHVWFTHDPGEQPMVYRIGREFLPGRGAMKTVQVPVLGPDGKPQKDLDGKEKTTEKTVPANVLEVEPTDEHTLPLGKNAEEIVRVEQVFDIRTVPIKRIDRLVLGKRDSRSAEATLKTPLFIKEKAADDPNNPAGPPVPGGNMPPVGIKPGAAVGLEPGGRGPLGFGPNSQQGSGEPEGGGPLATVIDGSKNRYLDVTQQVRRMPVGILVVVDQEYIQDVLLAFANSPLRFQITQVEWTRFRGTLEGIGNTGGTDSSGGIVGGRGTVNFGGPADPDSRPGSYGPRPNKPGLGVPFGGSSGGPPRPSSPGGPPGFGPPTGPGGYPGYGGNSSTVSESQITSGLVELSIYGVVSLYEKYTEPKADAAGAPGTSAPAPAPAPAPGNLPGPAPMPPGVPSNMQPKKRRRIRN